MFDRRQLIAAGAIAGLAAKAEAQAAQPVKLSTPCVVSTWDFGVAANGAAWKVLAKGGAALDAVEAGARVPEADLSNHSVGRAGYPDRDGHVSLDASIMDQRGDCGAVAGLEHIAHPISVARRVMEKTPHVLLVGDGALQFAVEQGFKREELLTPQSRKAWKAWLKEHRYDPVANSEVKTYGRDLGLPGGKTNHDTLGMLALDARSDLSGACTTSGMAWKLRGRVGDSPIIGAGLYVDNEVGAATSTGVGEEVIRNVGSFLVVELMRQGRSPRDACREAVQRILRRNVTRDPDFQVGFLAISKKGEVGAWAVQKGFSYACCDSASQVRIVQSESFS
ncbi:N(4)-(beta-N-acetylglucosaminyl)-L-asparaginase [Phenylobacterium sp.]|uniref:N(4)-(beta-N-acetylglucosaminyl)-L-asparaginase n=1 Tax=Phenylobacterium sp. TaxID=1871053 RepID=UPI002BC6BC1E|nr:N(4)-(beta-N-acetylglucosaminyl)-L-asparaginase [Phenylobacterium sp.]HLZ76352.1 N(4)-(beta-N-acetylglucosaminyl)-L-asparaginase [Phenylobacterium sp.]